MAKKLIQDMTDGSAVADTDLFEVSRPVGEAFVDRKLSAAQIRAGLEPAQVKHIAAAAPTADDDAAHGYPAWSLWCDTHGATPEVYRSVDGSTGAAVWVKTTLTIDEFGSAAMAATTDFTPAAHAGAGGTAHAAATTLADGFMSAADKEKLDGVASGATAVAIEASTVPVMNGTAAVGVAATVSRSDHVHPSDTSKSDTGHGHTLSDVSDAGALASGDDASDVPTVLTNFGKYTLTASETNGQAAIEKLDGESLTQTQVYIPSTVMGAADADGIAKAQQLVGAGDLILDGDLIAAGAWASGNANVSRPLTMYCAGDMSGVDFTIYYTNGLGVASTVTVSGANATTKTMVASLWGVSKISASAAVGTDVTFGVGSPIVRCGAQFGLSYLVEEGASDWTCSISNWADKTSASALATGKTAICDLLVLKDATPRTITFTGSGGLTAKVLGAALETGNASKYASYTIHVDSRKDQAFVRNAGVEA